MSGRPPGEHIPVRAGRARSRAARPSRAPGSMRLHVVKRTCDIIRLGVDNVIRRVSDSFSECHFAVTTFRVIYILSNFSFCTMLIVE